MSNTARRGLKHGVVVSLLLALGLGAWLLRPAPTAQIDPAASYAAAFGGPFTLTDQHGRRFGDKDLHGRPFALFFGFTHCPDVCPTTLGRIARLRAQLGKDSDKIDIVFVTVDPAEDTPEQIGRYLALFDTPIIGLTGTEEDLAAARRAYAAYAERVPLDGGGYTIDHTATVFLMGSEGQFVTTLDIHEGDAPALAKLRRLARS